MTDRELLELAAKAYGIIGEFVTDYGSGDYYYQGNQDGILYEHEAGGWCVWNPLADDGDALRLAVKLKLRMSTVCNDGNSSVASATDMYIDVHVEEHNGDPCAATRRTIVRAAAEIGKGMK